MLDETRLDLLENLVHGLSKDSDVLLAEGESGTKADRLVTASTDPGKY